jgi:hypothetical protein
MATFSICETVEKQLSYFPVLPRTHNVYGRIRLFCSVFKMIFVSMMVSQKDNILRVLLQSPFQATLKEVTFF